MIVVLSPEEFYRKYRALNDVSKMPTLYYKLTPLEIRFVIGSIVFKTKIENIQEFLKNTNIYKQTDIILDEEAMKQILLSTFLSSAEEVIDFE